MNGIMSSLNGQATPTYATVKPQIVVPMPEFAQTPTKALRMEDPVKKKSVYETGMANTINNIEMLAETLTVFIPGYAPSNPLLTVVAIEAKRQEALTLMIAVYDEVQNNSKSIINRHLYFDDLPNYSTRIVNALIASGASNETVKRARGYDNKIKGNRALKIKDDDEAMHISVSQRSYAQLVEHFRNLVMLVEAEPLYDPHTDDLKVVELNLHLGKMEASNTRCNVSNIALSMARMERNQCFNEKRIGLIDVGLTAKNEVKAVYGASSPQFYMVSGLAFRRINTR